MLHGSVTLTRHDTFELAEEIWSFERLRKSAEIAPDLFEREARQGRQDAFDVGDISRPKRQGLHDDDVLRRCESKRHAANPFGDRPPDHFDLERYGAEADIEIHLGRMMAQKQDTRRASERKCVGPPRLDSEPRAAGKEIGPVLIEHEGYDIHVPRHAWTAMDRSGDAADHCALGFRESQPRRGGSQRIEQRRERGRGAHFRVAMR